MGPITTCLWFDGAADEAVDTYVALFPNSRRLSSMPYGPDGPGEEGTTLIVNFEINGMPFMALNGGPSQEITPGVSFMVSCADQGELDHYWDSLLEGGTALQCGWLTDRFGVSWQIIPARFAELMGTLEDEAGRRVYQAMLQMVKLDIATLEAAAAG